MIFDAKAREIAHRLDPKCNDERDFHTLLCERITIALRECRDEALEEAAKICDQRKEDRYTSDCAIEAESMAKDIRAKK